MSLLFFSKFPLFLLLITLGVGTARAFTRGGGDFAVFYQAWKLVWNGQGMEIYRISPDRFLYAPGFAWLFAPIGALPPHLALGLWCLLKATLLFYFLWRVSRFLNTEAALTEKPIWTQWNPSFRFSICCLATLFVVRPLLIDFEYGQVNLLILIISVLGLIGHFEKAHSRTFVGFDFWNILQWCNLAIMAVGKLFPLPLLCVPWIATSGRQKEKLWSERAGIFIGIGVSLLLPCFSEGATGSWHLLQDWAWALVARGLPLESHNQSFIALIHHYLSGQPTQVLSEGTTKQTFGWALLSSQQIIFISAVWIIGTAGGILFWLFQYKKYPALQWIGILMGLLILPSHLVWKPYFIMGLPLAILLLYKTFTSRSWSLGAITCVLFLLLNCTSFDFVGHIWGARFEAASIFMWVHLSMLGVVFKTRFLR